MVRLVDRICPFVYSTVAVFVSCMMHAWLVMLGHFQLSPTYMQETAGLAMISPASSQRFKRSQTIFVIMGKGLRILF